jgi:hypothetical protein
MPLSSLNRLGFWSGALAAAASVAFSGTALLHQIGLLELPWNPDIPDGASFVLALSFVVLLASIYQSAPAGARIWGLIGLAFAVLYAAMVTQVYMTIITVVTPAQQSGSAAGVNVAPFVFNDHGSYMSAIDGLGYFLMSLATWFAAPVFAGESQRWVRRWFIANGVVGIPVLLAYMPLVIPQPVYGVVQLLAAPWIVTLPVATWLAAREFRRRSMSEEAAEPDVRHLRQPRCRERGSPR